MTTFVAHKNPLIEWVLCLWLKAILFISKMEITIFFALCIPCLAVIFGEKSFLSKLDGLCAIFVCALIEQLDVYESIHYPVRHLVRCAIPLSLQLFCAWHFYKYPGAFLFCSGRGGDAGLRRPSASCVIAQSGSPLLFTNGCTCF